MSILFFAVGAQAEPAPNDSRDKAKSLYEAGTTHYNLSEYADALKDFKEAYRLVHDPVLLFNIAQCHRQLREFEEAARLYRSYRREYPDAPNREEVDRLITQMDRAIAERPAQPSPSSDHNPAATGATAPVSNSSLTVTAAPPPRPRPVYKKAWFWGVVGGVAIVAAGVTVGVVLGTAKKDPTPQLPDVRF